MKLYLVRGGTEKELLEKEYNLGIGISLGNKWFTTENIVELTKWTLSYTKDKVIIYVADSIHAINLEVRNNITFEAAKRNVDRKGMQILEDIKKEVEARFSESEKERIMYLRWNDIVDDEYQKKVTYLYKKYKEDVNFANSINNLVREFTNKEERKFSDSQIERLGNYILEELPECLCRVNMGGIVCDAYVYPHDGPVTILVEKIQKGEIFPEIKENIIDTDPKVLIVVR